MRRGKLKMGNSKVDLFKEMMGSYPTGVTIVTTMDEKNPIGLTVNSFASVSIEPLMVLWCIDKRANSYETFKKTDKFAVNILAGDQKDECFVFASSKEKDRFSKTNWNLSSNNLPILDGTFGVFECKKVNQVDAGDHLILIGEVIDLNKNEKEPMLYFRRDVGFIREDWNKK